ncbi:RdRP-domain-containing protein [Mycena indigotica]|uniref:RNA-dependent RNA polymerase n=1 Tax=Mycena indigotica TaxID=2126181 RepID=A0A8H6WBK3_9AGAR|nr:RdRP-domain-containing protein [Mycena indigotica]KAF7306444.1 RdRP-domain-containing protein [Mycena indigotica]
MQLFMRNIAFAVTEDDLKLALAERLHRPPFNTEPRINFHIHLFRAPRSRAHKGMGLLTLPTDDVATLFLGIYGVSGINLQHCVMLFTPSTKPLDTALVEAVRVRPYVDPRRVQQDNAHKQELSGSIALKNFSFGRICRDGVFSPEVSYYGHVACNLETRRLDITCQPPTAASASSSNDEDLSHSFSRLLNIDFKVNFDRLLNTDTSVHYTARHISTFVVSGERVFLQSDLPPNFQRPSGSILSNMINPGDIFEENVKALHFPNHQRRDVRVEMRQCYDSAKMERLRILLGSLDFALAFQIDKAVWTGMLEPSEVLSLEQDLRELQQATDPTEVPAIFRHFLTSLESPELGVTVFAKPKKRRRRRRRNNKPQDVNEPPEVVLTDLKDHLTRSIINYIEEITKRTVLFDTGGIYEAYHLTLTPSTQILDGPLPDQSNSVLRRFKNNESFLRVSFQDENRSALRQDPALRVSINELLENRYKAYLNSGIWVAGRHYEFLGYSMSGLKEYSFIFVTPFDFEGVRMNAKEIRGRLGDFSKVVYQPAMLGARWAQAFSSSYPSVTLTQDQILFCEDEYSADGDSCFSDGCSSISPDLLRQVWKTQRRSLKIRFPPSALQFRCYGAKGVLACNPELPPGKLTFRPSQRKFSAEGILTLDIATTSARPILMYLNRPLIAMLEHHGVSKKSFMDLQKSAIDEVHGMKYSLKQASKIFSQHGLGQSYRLPSLFNNIYHQLKLEVGDWSDTSVLHHQLIKTAIAFATMHILREIKHRGHILVPGSYTLIGVVDEWDCLEEGEIYATVVDERNKLNLPVTGRILITRSPQIHPGDVQFVNAVQKPQLAHLTNVVVFSAKGSRSLPSMLGGGDLDGDIYNLILDETLYPPKGYTAEPGSYLAIPPKKTTNPCTVSDVVDFVIDYIKSDLLGLISILHLRIGDLKEYDCQECLKLAEKASHAVDFQKRGVPVSFTDLPRAPSNLKPDYLSGEGVNPAESMVDRYYPSKKVLGDLYRNVPIEDYRPTDAELLLQRMDGDQIYVAFQNMGLRRLGLPSVDSEVSEDLMDEMKEIMDRYSDDLLEIAKAHTISHNPRVHLSEAELTEELTKLIRYEFQSLEYRPQAREAEDSDDDEWEDSEEIAGNEERRADRFMRAWAAWLVVEETLDEDKTAFGPSSFGLLALGTMLDVIKEAKDNM